MRPYRALADPLVRRLGDRVRALADVLDGLRRRLTGEVAEAAARTAADLAREALRRLLADPDRPPPRPAYRDDPDEFEPALGRADRSPARDPWADTAGDGWPEADDDDFDPWPAPPGPRAPPDDPAGDPWGRAWATAWRAGAWALARMPSSRPGLTAVLAGLGAGLLTLLAGPVVADVVHALWAGIGWADAAAAAADTLGRLTTS